MVQFEKLHEIFRGRQILVQIVFSILVNWIVTPLFTMHQTALYLDNNAGSLTSDSLPLLGPSRPTKHRCTKV